MFVTFLGTLFLRPSPSPNTPFGLELVQELNSGCIFSGDMQPAHIIFLSLGDFNAYLRLRTTVLGWILSLSHATGLGSGGDAGPTA